ncbi:MAG: glycosyltransferase family 25 protein [Betaproteobacteria bacterium]|nr:glycosyltransferase family 25 protein [Betaproteobacteria bacterium]
MEQFQRCVIVNLPERIDRRREMDFELGQAGLAADGARIRYFRAVRPADAGEFPSLGARGCFMSHLGILKEAIRDDLDNILVMEDDLALDPRVCAAPHAMLGRLKDGCWDFAYFGHVEPTEDRATPGWQETRAPLATTHFYALNRRVLRPLHDHLEDCLRRPSGHPLGSPMHVDGAYSLFRLHHPDVITLMATPSLGGQRSSRSDIFPNKWYDRMPFIRQLAGMARGIKNRAGRKPLQIEGAQHV